MFENGECSRAGPGVSVHAEESGRSERLRHLRIGVTGHREERLGNGALSALRSRIAEVLATIGQSCPGQVTVVSPLADGADQLVAEEALAAGFRLECPLPFARDEYARDFQADAAAFHALLARAAVVEELSGSRATPDAERAAYAAVGERVLRDADLLLAVWDGLGARGAGGTAEVVGSARSKRIPIVWIDARPPHRVDVLTGDGAATASLAELVRSIGFEQPRNG